MLATISALDAADSGRFQLGERDFETRVSHGTISAVYSVGSVDNVVGISVVFLPLDLLAQIGDAIDNALVDLVLNDRGELGDGGGHVLGQHGLEQVFEDGHGTTPKISASRPPRMPGSTPRYRVIARSPPSPHRGGAGYRLPPRPWLALSCARRGYS